MKILLILFVITCCINASYGNRTVTGLVVNEHRVKYRADWKDLDKRPLPKWYDSAKVGIFIHWGVFSVPSFGSEWFWLYWKLLKCQPYENFMERNYPPDFTYQEFAPMFKAEFFDPNQWADLFQKAGAKYVVLTSKHHEGYTLFPSRRSFSWNSVDVGPGRDLVGDLSAAVKDKGLKFGVYHSLFEWFNPIYMEDKDTLYQTRQYPETKLWPDIEQLVNDYKPSILWSDGDWEAKETYWNSTGLLAWLYNDSPVRDEIVVNDRWGIGTQCHHGDFYNCQDHYNPGVLQNHKWENAFTIDKKSWGYRRNIDLGTVMTQAEMLQELVSTVSCGGNVLINIGPTKEGTIAPIFQERLLATGEWLAVNGEAIYDTSPWSSQNDSSNPHVWYTCRKEAYNGRAPTAPPAAADRIAAVYAIALRWPPNNELRLKDAASILTDGVRVQLLGNEDIDLQWKVSNGVALITFPDKASVKSQEAWTLKITKNRQGTTESSNEMRGILKKRTRNEYKPKLSPLKLSFPQICGY